jgi:hypothetical protein
MLVVERAGDRENIDQGMGHGSFLERVAPP